MFNFAAILLFMMVCSTRADYCQDNMTLAEFPEGILKQVLSLLTEGIINDFLGCPGDSSVSNDSVKLWLYNRANAEIPILLDPSNPSQVDVTKAVIMLAHGWLCNVTNNRIPELRMAYLERYDANVIAIDWSAISIGLYTDAVCSLPGIAEIVAAFLCKLHSLGVDLSKVHMIGHSLGGQLCGLVGEEVQRQCEQKLGRITGLDPAGPLYQFDSPDERLDPSDANFVDVIHTNMNFLGYWGVCGTVDFYPNCGTFQPGCLRVDNTTNIEDLINLPITIGTCNHIRACDYMVESIRTGGFTSQSCELCPGLPVTGPCVADILNPKFTPMGENCPADPPARKFYLQTNSESPFSRG